MYSAAKFSTHLNTLLNTFRKSRILSKSQNFEKSYKVKQKALKTIRFECFLLELLSRFERPTSSLPITFCLFVTCLFLPYFIAEKLVFMRVQAAFPVVSCRNLFWLFLNTFSLLLNTLLNTSGSNSSGGERASGGVSFIRFVLSMRPEASARLAGWILR